MRKKVDKSEEFGRDIAKKIVGAAIDLWGAKHDAIEASRKCVKEPGKTGPTPFVGAAITIKGKVIAVAYRGEIRPGEHAEFTLLERKLKGEDLRGTTLYTTLEPCTRRNPPKVECAQRIIDRGVGHVVIGSLDPNPDVCGVGELRLRRAGIRVDRFDNASIEEIEELNSDFFRQFDLNVKLQRTASERVDPVEPGELFGPNGYTIGYDEEGNKVEWLPDDENANETFPMILRRNDRTILDTYNEHWEKVWWNRHMYAEHREDEVKRSCARSNGIGCKAAARIQKKYGKKNLIMDDVEWGLLQGRMSALAWVMGSEWEESLDT